VTASRVNGLERRSRPRFGFWSFRRAIEEILPGKRAMTGRPVWRGLGA
jgi:hypothetical protein